MKNMADQWLRLYAGIMTSGKLEKIKSKEVEI
jgi:hypothetical protein